MLPKNRVPRTKSGKILPQAHPVPPEAPNYAMAIARALRSVSGSGGGTAKQLERWTGASNRTVRGWLSGARGPSGEHLMILARQSDTVLEAVLNLAVQGDGDGDRPIQLLRRVLVMAVAMLEEMDKARSTDLLHRQGR